MSGGSWPWLRMCHCSKHTNFACKTCCGSVHDGSCCHWNQVLLCTVTQGGLAHQHSFCDGSQHILAQAWSGCFKQKRGDPACSAPIPAALLESQPRPQAQGCICDMLAHSASAPRDSGTKQYVQHHDVLGVTRLQPACACSSRQVLHFIAIMPSGSTI